MKNHLLSFMLLIPILSSALNPAPDFISHPDSIGIPYENHLVQASDSAVLDVWKLLPPSEKDLGKTIIVAYGDSGNKSYWLNHGAMLSQTGFTVILFDYRGFGKSSEFKINPAYLYYKAFEDDLDAIINWTKEHQKNHQVSVWALSMGTIIATQVIPNNNVDFLIAEGYVRSPMLLKTQLLNQKDKEVQLPASVISYSQNLSAIDVPMLIFAGDKDQFMPVEDCKEIAEMKANRKIYEYEGGHLDGFRVLTGKWFGENYIKEIISFTDANRADGPAKTN